MENTTIAKLLAKENITVTYGNYRTAFFDVEKRELGLPRLKYMDKDINDLMTGHEVGHALYTPADGWHDSITEIPNVPRAYINVVEDIRIEKHIQRQYPGLGGCFKRGYSKLNDEDFFGIVANNIDVPQAHLIDRINLKAKLRTLIDVEFSSKEQDVVNQAFAVETWEDVLEACKAIYNFIEENRNEETKHKAGDLEQSDPTIDIDVSFSDSGSNSGNGEENPDAQQFRSSSSPEASGSGRAQSAAAPKDVDRSDLNEEGELSVATAGGAGAIDPHQNITHDYFRNMENTLLDIDQFGRQRRIVKAITRKQAEEMIITYKELFDMRDKFIAEEDDNEYYYYNDNGKDAYEEELKQFNIETKKYVGVMAKEFEMRKQAYRYSRSATARSGSLDMTKVHSYRYNDDIFNRVTQMADAKSHGMVLIIDFSGSMSQVIGDVIRQALTLASFCKKVSIPFEVYSFTTKNHKKVSYVPIHDNMIDHTDGQIIQLLTSSMSKVDYLRGYNDLFRIVGKRFSVRLPLVEQLGGTPLNQTIMASRFILADFKAKHNIQKINAIFLTDGDAQSMYVKGPSRPEDQTIQISGETIYMDGKFVDGARGYSSNRDRTTTENLLKILGQKYNIVGFFVCDGNQINRRIYSAVGEFITTDKLKEIRKYYNKNKFVSFANSGGYNTFYIIKGERNSLDTSDDEFEVSENANKSEIQRAFKKFTNSKKSNKIFATEFAKMVA
tara:strand:- start:15744 stop:17918 length:2175 start_codon:yes stop_codon:yes gene_type:complete